MAYLIGNQLDRVNWEQILLNSNIQSGSGLIGYTGVNFQRGYGLGSFFRSLFRLAAPLTKSVLKTVAREGVRTAAAVGSDLLEGRNIKESLKEQSKASGKSLLRKGIKGLKKIQKGGKIQQNTLKRLGYRDLLDFKKSNLLDKKPRKRRRKIDFLGTL